MKLQVVLKATCEDSHDKASVSIKYSEDGHFIASAGADKKAIIYNATDGNGILSLKGKHSAGLNDISWLSTTSRGNSSALLVTASDDSTIKVHDIEYEKTLQEYLVSRGKSCPYCLDINPVNSVITCGDIDGSLSSFHFNSKDSINSFVAHSKTIVSVKYSLDGQELMSGSLEGIARQWLPSETPVCLRTIVPCPRVFTPISCVQYTDNCKYILSSTLDSTHRLFCRHDSELGNSSPLLREYKGHTNTKFSICSTTTSFRGRSLVLSGSENGFLYIYDAESQELLASVETNHDMVMSVAVRPFQLHSNDLLEFSSTGSDGKVRLWTLCQIDDDDNDEKNIRLGGDHAIMDVSV